MYDNFNIKILVNFNVKIVIQNLMCQILCIFKEKWFIFSFINKALRRTSVKHFSTAIKGFIKFSYKTQFKGETIKNPVLNYDKNTNREEMISDR